MERSRALQLWSPARGPQSTFPVQVREVGHQRRRQECVLRRGSTLGLLLVICRFRKQLQAIQPPSFCRPRHQSQHAKCTSRLQQLTGTKGAVVLFAGRGRHTNFQPSSAGSHE